MRRVEPSRRGLRWHLGADEVELLRDLVGQVDETLDGPLDDPVVQRLFPAAVEDDAAADAELRALLAGELLLERHEAVAAFLGLLDDAAPVADEVVRVLLVDGQPDLVLGILNDVRLALGARVGFDVVAAREDGPPPDDPHLLAVLDTMDWLAMHQSLLLEQLS